MKGRPIGKTISIIGLGQMGTKLAQIYREAGFKVSVWNRDITKANKVHGVTVAETASDAIDANELSLICVHDNVAVREILDSLPDLKIIAGKIIVNFSTGSPEEAAELETMISSHGGYYLNGAIQVAPEQMAQAGTTILMAGNIQAAERIKPVLDLLGGNIKHLHADAAASPAMDLASLTWLYGSYIGLMYGVKLCQSFGLKLDDYKQVIGDVIPGFSHFFQHEIDMINTENWQVTQSPLSINVSATVRIAATLKKLPVAQEFPTMIAAILKEAAARGFESEELAAIIKVIGNPAWSGIR